MLGKEHVTFGLATSATISLASYNPDSAIFAYPAIVVGFSTLGSLLPDIDDPGSYAGRYVLPIAELLNKIGHRTNITHDLRFMIPLFLISVFTKNPIFFGIMFGVMGHLFLDGLTKMGICFGKKNVSDIFLPKKIRVKADSFAAKVLTYALCVGFMFGVNYLHELFLGNNLINVLTTIIG